MEHKDFRKTAALDGGDVDRVHIIRTSTSIIRMVENDNGIWIYGWRD